MVTLLLVTGWPHLPGTQTYLIKLKASDTLEKLRTYLRSYRDGDDNFEVVRTYPFQVSYRNLYAYTLY